MMIRSRTIIATPPGASIREQLVDRGMSQKEFALRMGMSQKHISRLINGEVQLTAEAAIRLEMVLGIPAAFWSNLEAIYRDKLLRAEEENSMDEDLAIAGGLPCHEMSALGWIPDSADAAERVTALRRFFEVARLSLLSGQLLPGIACRRLSVTKKSDAALLAWAQEARLEARKIPVKPFSAQALSAALPSIRAMTMIPPEQFCPELSLLLARSGVAIVFLPHMEGSFLHGAAFRDGHKIVLGLTVRGRDADRFWFSLFHELGHILLGHLDLPLLTDAEEKAADDFARAALIPEDAYSAFLSAGDLSSAAIKAFAAGIGIDPGIAVGRLQKDGHLPYSRCNDLKTRYEIS